MSEREVHRITDSRVLAAMAHPLRRRLLDILRVDGAATASMLATRTDQAVGNISHHLRTLAACELVTEAPELARDRRERWWRLEATTLRWSSTDFQDDPSAEAIARASFSLDLDRQVGHVLDFGAVGGDERDWWAEGPFSTSHWMRLTAAELEQVSREVVELLSRWSNREPPEDGQERRTAFVFAHGVPARP